MLLHLLGRGATPEQVRDTLTVCFIGLAALGALALAVTGHARAPRRHARRSAWSPPSPSRTWSAAAASPSSRAGEHYERVLTGVMVVAVVVGLIGALS